MGPLAGHSKTEPLSVSHTANDTLAATPAEVTPTELPVASPASVPQVAALSTEQEIALNNIIADVRNKTAIDSAAEHKLRMELRAARQEEWPLVVKQFQSAIAYSAQLAAHDAAPQAPIQHASHKTASSPATLPTPEPTIVSDEPLATASPLVTDASIQLASHNTPANETVENVAPRANAPTRLPVRGTTVANLSVEPEPTTIEPVIRQATHLPATSVDWQTQIDTAIETMRDEVKSEPGSVAEMQEHMRLRMLLLLAGREEESLVPIPGSSPTEQDYWSNQLFALSTYLAPSRQPDTKQRAAGALVHLDAARAKLAELATLQIRNLAFVDNVEGYGLYQVHKSAKFKSGELVKLYAEIDNFRSVSTKDGYRTTLATSYEVVDPQGRRIEGAEFPEVEEVCKSQRRDYHMRYEFSLPERIYPGEYEIRLVITDRLSQKIGHATLPFVIVD